LVTDGARVGNERINGRIDYVAVAAVVDETGYTVRKK
jgi:hypothetical protein